MYLLVGLLVPLWKANCRSLGLSVSGLNVAVLWVDSVAHSSFPVGTVAPRGGATCIRSSADAGMVSMQDPHSTTIVTSNPYRLCRNSPSFMCTI